MWAGRLDANLDPLFAALYDATRRCIIEATLGSAAELPEQLEQLEELLSGTGG